MKPAAAAIFRRGQKEELFDAIASGTDDATLLESKLAELCAIWAVPRAGKDLAAGIWRPGIGAVEVLVRGKQTFAHIGFMMAKKLYLQIEEAVYLVDRSNLLLFVEEAGGGKRLLSLQEAYALMEALGVSMQRYVLFSHLSRAGFVVKRYPSRFVLQGSEKPQGVWGCSPAWRGCDGFPAGASSDSGRDATRQPRPSTSAAAGEQQPHKRHKSDKAPAVQQACWWPSIGEQHPMLQGISAEVETQSIPINCNLSAELRRRFPRLQPLPSIPRPTPANASPPSPCSQLVFDVYPSGMTTKRTSPDPVAFRLCVVTSDHFPTLQDIQASAQSSPDAPVRFVSVEDGDCMFFNVQSVNLLDSIKQPKNVP